MTRSGQMRARDFVRLVAEGARTESEIFVLEALLGQASRALNSFADPQWAESTGRALLSDALLEAARSAAPGSDQQLAFVQSLSAQVMGDDAAKLKPTHKTFNATGFSLSGFSKKRTHLEALG